MASFLVTGVILLIYIVITAGVIYALVPRKLLLPPRLRTLKQLQTFLSLRNDSIEIGLKLCAAFGLIGSFLFGVVQFTTDQNFKSRQLSADMLSKAIAQLEGSGTGDHSMSAAGAVIALGLTAKLEKQPDYQTAISETLASFIRWKSQEACGNAEYTKASYVARADLQAAFRVFGDRNEAGDIAGRTFNLEFSCLVGIDLAMNSNSTKIKGLSGVRLAGSKLLRADLSALELIGTDFRGIEAGDWRNENWASEIEQSKIDLHEMNGNEFKYNHLRRRYVAHFVEANLTRANFEGAGLQGADFSRAVLTDANLKDANVSRANFRDAVASPEQLLKTCIGRRGFSKEQNDAAQPKLTAAQAEALGPEGIPYCW